MRNHCTRAALRGGRSSKRGTACRPVPPDYIVALSGGGASSGDCPDAKGASGGTQQRADGGRRAPGCEWPSARRVLWTQRRQRTLGRRDTDGVARAHDLTGVSEAIMAEQMKVPEKEPA